MELESIVFTETDSGESWTAVRDETDAGDGDTAPIKYILYVPSDVDVGDLTFATVDAASFIGLAAPKKKRILTLPSVMVVAALMMALMSA